MRILRRVFRNNSSDITPRDREVDGGRPDSTLDIAALRNSAARGDVSAMNNLAYLHAHGDLRDSTEEARYWRNASEAGHAGAQYNLACLYGAGEGVPYNEREAYRWFRKAAQQGHIGGVVAVASRLEWRASGAPAQAATLESAAAKHFMFAAHRGHAGAQCELARLYFDGRGIVKSSAESLRWFREAAFGGDHTAAGWLADIYEHGRLGVVSFAEAARWRQVKRQTKWWDADRGEKWRCDFASISGFTLPARGGDVLRPELKKVLDMNLEAATGGSAVHMLALGLQFEFGFGGSPSDTMAVHWYRRAAECGNFSLAFRALGRAYANGYGLDQNEAEAVSWWARASDAGDLESQREIWRLLVRSNPEQGKVHLLRAVNAGDASAQCDYAWWLNVREPMLANFWFRRAAEQGDATAQYMLSARFDGRLDHDPQESLLWLKRAAERDHSGAQESLAESYFLGSHGEQCGALAAYWQNRALHLRRYPSNPSVAPPPSTQ